MNIGGNCISTTIAVTVCFWIVVFVLLLAVVCWILDLFCCRGSLNKDVEQLAIEFRMRTKLRMPNPKTLLAKRGDESTSGSSTEVQSVATTMPASISHDDDHHRDDDDTSYVTEGITQIMSVEAVHGATETALGGLAAATGVAAADDKHHADEVLEVRRSMGLSETSNERPFWSLATNLMQTAVAGPGTVLFFNFQFLLIFWSGCAFAVWHLTVYFAFDPKLLLAGVVDYDQTPREECISSAFSVEHQAQTAAIRAVFCACLYVISYFGLILFSYRQQKRYLRMDANLTTMKDFAAHVTGLPELTWDEPVEQILAEAIKTSTGEKGVVGVSVCWNFAEKEELVTEAVKDDLEEMEDERLNPHDAAAAHQSAASPPVTEPDEVTPLMNLLAVARQAISMLFMPFSFFTRGLRNVLWRRLETGLLKLAFGVKSPTGEGGEEGDESGDREAKSKEVEAVLKEMKTTESAFVVFESEEVRDRAVAKCCAAGGYAFRDGIIQMHAKDIEPFGVHWKDMNVTPKERYWLIGKSTILALVLTAIWVVCSLGPYVYWISMFKFKDGDEPGAMADLVLSGIVVVAQLVLFLVCDTLSEKCRFQLEDEKMCFYMVLYTGTNLFGTLLQLAVVGFESYWIEAQNGAKTNSGQPLKDSHSFQDIIGSLSLQARLGRTLYSYVFPASTLVPFLLEPVAVIWFPYKLGRSLVQNYKGVKRTQAEQLLQMPPFDAGRYGDLLVNVNLTVLGFLTVPMGYVYLLLRGLFVSQVYLYLYDHVRVLRWVPSFSWSTNIAERYGQQLLTVAVSVILMAAIYHANCADFSAALKLGDAQGIHQGYCLKGWRFGFLLITALALHFITLTAILRFIVPLTRVQHRRSLVEYRDAAVRTVASWFNCNPMYCLRSKYFYKHEPHCAIYMPGKEHLLKFNEQALSFYEEKLLHADDSVLPGFTAAASVVSTFVASAQKRKETAFEKAVWTLIWGLVAAAGIFCISIQILQLILSNTDSI